MFKDEGEVYEEGFALNAENLNALVNGYKISSTEDVWTENNTTSEINITTFKSCYIEVLSNHLELFSYTLNSIDDKNFTLVIRGSNYFEMLETLYGDIQIELSIVIYDQLSEQKIGLINYTITYVGTSQTVID